jgi:hypothetical protein
LKIRIFSLASFFRYPRKKEEHQLAIDNTNRRGEEAFSEEKAGCYRKPPQRNCTVEGKTAGI